MESEVLRLIRILEFTRCDFAREVMMRTIYEKNDIDPSRNFCFYPPAAFALNPRFFNSEINVLL